MKVMTIVLVSINVLYISHIILNHIVFSYNWNLFSLCICLTLNYHMFNLNVILLLLH